MSGAAGAALFFMSKKGYRAEKITFFDIVVVSAIMISIALFVYRIWR